MALVTATAPNSDAVKPAGRIRPRLCCPAVFVSVSVRGKTHEPIASSSLFSQPVVRRCDSPADLGTEVKRAFARAHHIYHYSFNGHSAAGSSVGKPSVSAIFFWCPDLTVRLNLSYSSFFKVL